MTALTDRTTAKLDDVNDVTVIFLNSSSLVLKPASYDLCDADYLRCDEP